jgi:hypothetical protein
MSLVSATEYPKGIDEESLEYFEGKRAFEGFFAPIVAQNDMVA